MDRVRIALIGCGGNAKGHFGSYQAMAGQYGLGFCVEVEEAKARAFAE